MVSTIEQKRLKRVQEKKHHKNQNETIINTNITSKNMPSLLCSGCWPMEDLEEYIKQSQEKGKRKKNMIQHPGQVR